MSAIKQGEGSARNSAVTPSTVPRMTIEMPSNKSVPCVLIVVDRDRHGIAHGNLVAHHPVLEAAGVRLRSLSRGRRKRGRPSNVRTPSSQVLATSRVRLQPGVRGDRRLLVPVENRRHHLALAAQGELEIVEQRPMFGHSLR